jgi:uncharacterized protein
MDRRRFLNGLLSMVVLGAGGAAGCRRAPRRDHVLDGLAREIIAAETLEIARRSRELSSAVASFADVPRPPELNAARAEWKRAATVWKRGASFRGGPLVESNALMRAAYWPVRAEAIESLLRATQPVTPGSVEELGADVRGLYALEHLLFDHDPGPRALERFSGAAAGRALSLVRAYAENVVTYADRAAAAFGESAQSFAAAFAGAGQLSVNQLVSQMVEGVETLCESRLATVLWMEKVKRLEAGDVEGWASRISHQLALSSLIGTERLYAGGQSGGLAVIVENAAPEVHRRLRARFDDAIAQLRGLGAPLEAVVRTDPRKLEAAIASVKALEIGLKAELASALGVTLTFTSTDGD